jgi:hypothetical protein
MTRFALLLVGLAAFAAENPVAWLLSGNPPKPGASGTVRLTVRVEPGWHLYGLSQPDEGPRPTRIWLPEGQPYRINGPIKAPSIERKFDQNFGVEVEYFKGDIMTFQLPVKSTGGGTLRVAVQYQTCNDRLCLPPKTLILEK